MFSGNCGHKQLVSRFKIRAKLKLRAGLTRRLTDKPDKQNEISGIRPETCVYIDLEMFSSAKESLLDDKYYPEIIRLKTRGYSKSEIHFYQKAT